MDSSPSFTQGNNGDNCLREIDVIAGHPFSVARNGSQVPGTRGKLEFAFEPLS
jgi:hypothetical protein